MAATYPTEGETPAGEARRHRVNARIGESTGLLVQLARDGDEAAFEVLLRTHQDRAYAIALRMTGHAEDAQDATQEAFLRAWQGLPTFRDDADFGTWLTRIVLNCCHNQRRAERRTETLPEDDTWPSAPGADSVVLGSHENAAVQRAILALPFDQRAVLVLHVFTGCSYHEISEILGIAEGTAKVRVHRARRVLVTTLRDWR